MCGPAFPWCCWISRALAYSASIPTSRRRACASDRSVGPIARIVPPSRLASEITSDALASPLWYCSPQSPSAVMFTPAAWMNWRSVAEHVWPVAGFARPFVASVSARAHRAARPAAVRPRRRTHRLSSVGGARSSPFSGVRSEDQRAVRDRPPHADRLVDADRRRVLGTHEQADDRQALEQQPAEIAHAALGVATVAHSRVDPDLLELDCVRRPGGGL